MVRFKFTRNFNWEHPHPNVPSGRGTTAYKASDRSVEIPAAAADAAEAAGAGERVKVPKVTRATLKDRVRMAAGVDADL